MARLGIGSEVWHGVVLYGIARHGMVLYMVWYGMVRYSMVWCDISMVRYSMV